MYGMRTSREHFSVPGSNPVATSVDVHALAETARRIGGVGRGPAPVIAELVTGDWQLVHFAEADRLREITRAQGRKYEGVRAGRLRWSSTVRAVPPVTETAVPPSDLDVPAASRTHPEPW
ncbi:hypothetical protein ACRAJ3_03495 [Rhodococcus pyridinivorans]|uniref:hypothetical protein n=1 Tax=Rhodococcus pyridinivorans TaxID=103816 RepID=UPI001FFF537C|nr:hypothetical protein [Rhodococcus pyridinivorans]UPK63910.1 hypothetical protein MYP14_00305 [Rhodococcus pyridinivorans]